MFDAIVTFTSTEPDDISRAEMDTRIAAGEPIEHAVTEVHRVEFAVESDFKDWLRIGQMYSTSTEQLVAKQARSYTD
jgi:hypothetical protein